MSQPKRHSEPYHQVYTSYEVDPDKGKIEG